MRPNRVMLTPSETISVRSSQRTSFGATNATDGDSSSAPASRASASGSGAVSCASSHSAPSSLRGRRECGRRSEAGRRRRLHDGLGARGIRDLEEMVVTAADHDREDVDRPRLLGDRRETASQVERRGRAPVGTHDEDRVNPVRPARAGQPSPKPRSEQTAAVRRTAFDVSPSDDGLVGGTGVGAAVGMSWSA